MPGALEDATKKFNAQRVIKKNNEKEDHGVNKVLIFLKDIPMEDNMNNLKKEKDVKKDKLVAGRAFLRGHNLYDVKEEITFCLAVLHLVPLCGAVQGEVIQK